MSIKNVSKLELDSSDVQIDNFEGKIRVRTEEYRPDPSSPKTIPLEGEYEIRFKYPDLKDYEFIKEFTLKSCRYRRTYYNCKRMSEEGEFIADRITVDEEPGKTKSTESYLKQVFDALQSPSLILILLTAIGIIPATTWVITITLFILIGELVGKSFLPK